MSDYDDMDGDGRDDALEELVDSIESRGSWGGNMRRSQPPYREHAYQNKERDVISPVLQVVATGISLGILVLAVQWAIGLYMQPRSWYSSFAWGVITAMTVIGVIMPIRLLVQVLAWFFMMNVDAEQVRNHPPQVTVTKRPDIRFNAYGRPREIMPPPGQGGGGVVVDLGDRNVDIHNAGPMPQVNRAVFGVNPQAQRKARQAAQAAAKDKETRIGFKEWAERVIKGHEPASINYWERTTLRSIGRAPRRGEIEYYRETLIYHGLALPTSNDERAPLQVDHDWSRAEKELESLLK
jgi:hypothetical protein